MKKLLVGLSAIALAVASVPMFAAFEAHVINVTARIENALEVEPRALTFGTVFPQEKLDQRFSVSLSQSFQEENRVDDVRYILRQKPKCIDGQGNHPQVTEVERQFRCPPDSEMMPLLCPYLSKEEVTTDGVGGAENDGRPIPPFHGLPGPWTPSTTQAWQASGMLVKSAEDTSDVWNIDLKVPCFSGECAQDWASFVKRYNEQADPNVYMADPAKESELFGCDLWLEVTEVSIQD